MFTTNNSNIEINKIIEIIIKDCGKLSINLFENMDKNMAIELFEFINTYHYLLYISEETVNKLKDILSRCPYTKFTAEGLSLTYYSEDGVNDESWIAYRGRNMEDLLELALSSLS